MTLTTAQLGFLAQGRWALVSTVGRSGGPQISMVSYAWDDTAVVMSVRRAAVKWANVVRDPRIAVTVTDDLRCLTLYGTADCIERDPERETLTRTLQASLLPAHAVLLEQDFVNGLEAAGRVVIRLVPERAVGRI